MTNVTGSITLSAFLESADDRKLEFEQLPFSQPLFILYSSGTSGKPKCIVHSAGVSFQPTLAPSSSVSPLQQGVLLQTKKDIKMALGASVEDAYFQYTTVRPKTATAIGLDRTPL